MDWLNNLFWAVFGAILYPAFVLCHRKLVLNRKINVFRLSDRTQPVVVVPTIPNPETGRKFTTPLESVIVVNEIIKFYQRIFFTKESPRIYFSENLPTECAEGNIICIGGPVYNAFAKKLIEHMRRADGKGIPYYFDDHTLWSEDTHAEYNATRDSGKIVGDVCLVILTRNPWGGSKKLVLLLAGCSGYGAIGLAKYLGNGDLIRDLQERWHYRSGASGSFIVSFRVYHNENGPMDARYSDYIINEFSRITF